MLAKQVGQGKTVRHQQISFHDNKGLALPSSISRRLGIVAHLPYSAARPIFIQALMTCNRNGKGLLKNSLEYHVGINRQFSVAFKFAC
uniref:Uncharacterized protein n=1 Tax=Anguilla anguilla TaxID=7936 RepID=A0A0E9SR12_ANGAN